LFGYAAQEAIGRSIMLLIPPERREEEQFILGQVRHGERVTHYETVRQAKDGRKIDISLTISPMRDSTGRIIGASKVARDITDRKQAEMELADHRNRLEHLVRERTDELEASHKRLRLADRLASIGTLAAGLGHDMGNLLLPVRMRLESLERLDLPPAARDDLKAIKTASEYLKRLSQGLRLFALDPEDAGSIETTNVAHWWTDVEPFLRNTLPKGVRLESQVPTNLPPVSMPPHTFTQVVYNLVQNAGDVMRASGAGSVHLNASWNEPDNRVVISVSDNGPGMTDEVRQRCMEPFFTTKTRGISTGLGLALVRGAVLKSGGSIEIESSLGEGTTFHLFIPARCDDAVSAERGTRRRTAYVGLKDARLAAYVSSLLRSLEVEVSTGPWSGNRDVEMVVVDASNGCASDVEEYIEADERRRAVIFGDVELMSARPQISRLESRPAPAKIREAIEKAVKGRQPALQETTL
jgi:PAS domain S-box-containing protein